MLFFSPKSLFLILASLGCVSTFWAQSVYWSPSNGTLQQGKVNAIDLIYDSCQPDGDPDLPKLQSLELTFRGRSNSTSIVNGRLSAKTILNYQAVPARIGSLSIPSMRVKTSEGTLQVPAATFEVVEPTVGATGVSPSEVFLSLFQTKNEKIYQGEVFELEYIAGAKRSYQLADLSVPKWVPTEIVTRGLVEKQVSLVNYDGETYQVKLYTTRGMATEPGIKNLPSAQQEATVVVGRRRDFMFQEPVYDVFTLESDPFSLEVLPLPEGAPDSFTGAVGQFTLDSQVVPAEVQVGEPVTWTLQLNGSGNWPAGIGVPPRAVSSRFKAIQPEIKNEFPDDDLFTGSQSEDIVLIPTEAGTFEFGPLEYTYFDPEAERYQTIEIPSKTVTVVPTDPSNSALSSGEGSNNASSRATGDFDGKSRFDLGPAGQNAFEKPPELLREPLQDARIYAVPQANRPLLVPTLAALAGPACLWFLLALARSIATDPRKTERLALAELRKIAHSPLPGEMKDREALHRRWRDAAARYFALSTGEPSPQEISLAAEALRGEAFAKSWKRAWVLSDQALFGTSSADADEWHSLQKNLVVDCPSKGYSPALVTKSRAWAPAMILGFALASLAPQLDAQTSAPDGNELYLQGNFPAAAAKWAAAINAEPHVFAHRNNAGLAYAQTGDWGRAWAFWTSAYCLDPSNEALTWNLRIAHQNTSAYDPILQSLVAGQDLYRIVRLRSPAGWQALSTQAIWAMAGLLALAIVSLYLRPVRRAFSYLLVLGLLCGLSSYFAQWAYSKYGALGEADTLLVVSQAALLTIPTDLQTEQVSTTVAEGSVAKQDKTFLGWIKIRLPNGESGWLRRENVMPLYGQVPQL